MAHQDDHHGDSSKLGGSVQPNVGENREGTKSEQVISPRSVTYHPLHRTWPTDTNSSGQNEPQYPGITSTSAAMQRWIGETKREQPWNGVGSFGISGSKEK